MKEFTFPKAEHLCLKKDIDALFMPGSRSMTMFPIRTTYLVKAYEGHGPRVKVLISVSKRKFKHAVDRNRAKRQIREAYRLQKHLFLAYLPEGMAVDVAFIWLSGSPVSSKLVHTRMNATLRRLGEKCASTTNETPNGQ